MPLLLADIQKLQLPAIQYNLLEEIITKSYLFNVIDFEDIYPLTQNQYTREATLGTANQASFIGATGSVSESSPTFTKVNDSLKLIMDTVQVPKMAAGDPNQIATALRTKQKTVLRGFEAAAITGQNNAFEIAGLSGLVTAANSISANYGSATAGALALSTMDIAYDTVSQYNDPTFILANAQEIRAYKTLLRASGGIQPYMVQLPNYGILGYQPSTVGFNGVPILRDDWIKQTETFNTGGAQYSSMYFIYSDAKMGYGGFYSGASVFDVSEPIYQVGNDLVGYNITMRVGISLKSDLALACIRGLLN